MASNAPNTPDVRNELGDSSPDVSLDEASLVVTQFEHAGEVQKVKPEHYSKVLGPSSGERPEDESEGTSCVHTGMTARTNAQTDDPSCQLTSSTTSALGKNMHGSKGSEVKIPGIPKYLTYGSKNVQETVHNSPPPSSPREDVPKRSSLIHYQYTGEKNSAMVLSGKGKEYEKSYTRILRLNLETEEKRKLANSYKDKNNIYIWPHEKPTLQQMVDADLKFKGMLTSICFKKIMHLVTFNLVRYHNNLLF